MPSGVKQIRTELGMSRHEFARALNITYMAVSNYENKLRYPAIDIGYRIINLAKNNGVDISLENIYPPDQKSIAAQH